MKTTKMSYEYVEDMPLVYEMKPEILYIQKKYHQLGHLCPCGCGEPVLIPYKHSGNDDGWELKISENGVSLHPSILRMSGCKSHYFITNGEINWA